MKNQGLFNRYQNLLKNWSDNEDFIVESWHELERLYSSPVRKYHSLKHLEDMFESYDEFKEELIYPKEVEFAIFYHDLIYKSWSQKNELNSAKSAKEILTFLNVDSDSVQRIFDLIMVTKTHNANENSDEKWIIDFDLRILGADWDSYQLYAENIRNEYRMFPDLMYKKGRKQALNHFLKRETIYQTEVFKQQYETKARSNIEKELKQL